MRKAILNVSLLMLLAGSMSTTFVGCKDYDDDITNINENADGLAKQIDALNTALQNYQAEASQAGASAQQAIKDAAAAAAKGDDALAAAKAAQAQADLAKEAAAQAKADAIAEVKKLLADADSKNAAEIAKLAARIDGIENGLANIDLTDINKQLGDQAAKIAAQETAAEALKVQIAALENFKASMNDEMADLKGKVTGLDTKISEANQKIDALTTQLTALEADVNANKADIASLKKQYNNIADQIYDINGQLNTIAGIMNRRLTSVTLIPDLYVGGIPTIEFFSAQYTGMTWNKDTKKWVKDTKATTVSNDETTATYRLNPSTVGEADVIANEIAYVDQVAEVRPESRSDVPNALVAVTKASFANGRLTVNMKKATTASLNLAGNKINTISLKVPVAASHLFDGEDEFSVYSEYVRLTEGYFKPELSFVPGAPDVTINTSLYANNHPADSAAVYQQAMNAGIAKSLVYDKSYDLNKLVEGCMFYDNDHNPVDLAKLAEYGMEIKYWVAAAPYLTGSIDQTNQQVYARINGSTLTPVSASGQAGNQSIIGRQPIIAAMLWDNVNNKAVDIKYFKVLFTATPLETEQFTIPTFDTDLECVTNQVAITWDQFAKEVLEKMQTQTGMSKEDFAKIYTNVVLSDGQPTDRIGLAITLDNTGASTPIMQWTINTEDLAPIAPNQVWKRSCTVLFTNPAGLYAPVAVTLNWNITAPAPAKLGTPRGEYWIENGRTMRIVPTPMPIPYDGSTAEYSTNILQGWEKPYVSNLFSCADWTVAFSKNNPTYPGDLSTVSPAQVWYTAASQATLGNITYSIQHNAAGIALVQSANATGHKDILLDWNQHIVSPLDNVYTFGNTTLRILQILSIDKMSSATITDNINFVNVDNLDQKYTLTDCYGNTVANTNGLPKNRYDFYAVKGATFTGDIKWGESADTPVAQRHDLNYANYQLTATVTGTTLGYKNEGSPLAKAIYLFVPVQVQHKWGTLTGEIVVTVNPALPAARR